MRKAPIPRLSRSRNLVWRVTLPIVLLVGYLGPWGSAAQAKDIDAVGIAIDAFVIAGPEIGISISAEEKQFLKPLVNCLIANGTAVDCGKRAVVGLLPEESQDFVSCAIGGDSLGNCAKKEVIKSLPADTKDFATCLLSNPSPQTCATGAVAQRLPPGERTLAECLAKASKPEECGKSYAITKAQQGAMDAYGKIKGDANGKAGELHGPIRNIIDVAQGIQDDDWEKVLASSSKALTKIAGHLVLEIVLTPPGAWAFGPALDSAVDNRIDVVTDLMKAAKAHDPGSVAKILVEAQIGYSTEVVCAVINGDVAFVGDIKEAVCGELGKVISMAGDVAKWGTGVLADLLHFKDAIDYVSKLLDQAVTETRRIAAGKHNNCDLPDKYYGNNFLRCYSKDAFLRQSGGNLAQKLSDTLYGQCRQHYKNCLFSGDGVTDEITRVCGPMRARFDNDTETLAVAFPKAAGKFVLAQRNKTCGTTEAEFEKLELDCEGAINKILPPTGNVDTADCGPPPQPTFGGPADTLYKAVCTKAVAAERQSRNDICLASLRAGAICFADMKPDAKGNCSCPLGSFWNGWHCAKIFILSGSGPTLGCRPPRPVGTPPNCCPEHTYFANGVCRRVAVSGTIPTLTGTPKAPFTIPRVTYTRPYFNRCAGARPVGTPPHCCPVGTYYAGGMCRRTKSPSVTPLRPGAMSNAAATRACPASRPVGRAPTCCPSGTRYAAGACRRPLSPVAGAAPTRTIGSTKLAQPVTRRLHAIGKAKSSVGSAGGSNETINYGACASCNHNSNLKGPN